MMSSSRDGWKRRIFKNTVENNISGFPGMKMIENHNRSRFLHVLFLIIVIAAGLASRKHPQLFPSCLGKYPGDALWALAAFVLWGLILESLIRFFTKP